VKNINAADLAVTGLVVKPGRTAMSACPTFASMSLGSPRSSHRLAYTLQDERCGIRLIVSWLQVVYHVRCSSNPDSIESAGTKGATL